VNFLIGLTNFITLDNRSILYIIPPRASYVRVGLSSFLVELYLFFDSASLVLSTAIPHPFFSVPLLFLLIAVIYYDALLYMSLDSSSYVHSLYPFYIYSSLPCVSNITLLCCPKERRSKFTPIPPPKNRSEILYWCCECPQFVRERQGISAP
jgi:hypothetical protein